MKKAPNSQPDGVIGGTKTCSMCGVAKPTELFGSWGNTRPGKVKAQCRECLNSRKREWHSKNSEYAHARNKTWLSDNQEKRKAYRAEYAPVYRLVNGEKLRERSRSSYRANPEKYKAAAKDWARSNKSKVVKASREYYQANQVNIKARVREWGANNPTLCRVYSARRRARSARTLWSSQAALESIYASARGVERATGVRYVVDHIYPLAGKTVCGLHCEANLRVIPFSVNARKGAKLPGFLADELWAPYGPDVFHETEVAHG